MLFDIKIHLGTKTILRAPTTSKRAHHRDPRTRDGVFLCRLYRTVYYRLNAMRVRRVYYYCRKLWDSRVFLLRVLWLVRQANRDTSIFISQYRETIKSMIFAHDGFPIKVHVLSFFARPAHFCVDIILCKFNITAALLLLIFFSHSGTPKVLVSVSYDDIFDA